MYLNLDKLKSELDLDHRKYALDQVSGGAYRLGVGLLIANRHKKVLVGRRVERSPHARSAPLPQPWQLPQGGIDPGESPESAALREMQEELGIRSGRIVAAAANLLRYTFSTYVRETVFAGRYQGQVQRWFLIEFLGEDTEIDVHQPCPEFDAWKWVDLREVTALAVPFKRSLYAEVTQIFAWYFA